MNIKFNIIGEHDFAFKPKKIIKKMLRRIILVENIKTRHVVSFIFVKSEEMHAINKKYRQIDATTDVISFANKDSEMLSFELGDIFLNLDLIKLQAENYGHSDLREFAFLTLHGILHLLGYDHLNEEDEKVMFARQDLILNQLKIERK